MISLQYQNNVFKFQVSNLYIFFLNLQFKKISFNFSHFDSIESEGERRVRDSVVRTSALDPDPDDRKERSRKNRLLKTKSRLSEGILDRKHFPATQK